MPRPAHIFITRKLNKKSPFYSLRSEGHSITAHSLIKFKFLKFPAPPFHNAVFFYSARAIAPYLKKHPYDKNLMYGVMGNSSNKTFKKLTGQSADLIYQGDMKALTKKINKRWSGYKVAFPMAKNSLHSLEKKLKNITSIPVIVYDNKISKQAKIPQAHILIFTSPLNLKAYLSKEKIKSNQLLFAIGPTTAKAIHIATGRKAIFPSEPSEDKVVKLIIKKLLKHHPPYSI